MLDLTTTQCFFYGGIAMMSLSIILGLLSMLIFMVTGKSLKRKLEEEYGEPERYNLKNL